MAKPDPRKTNGHARRKLRLRLKAERRPCHICGQPIDYDLPAGDPMSFEVDELVPVSRYWLGGYATAQQCALDYANVDAAHRICNQRRGNRAVGAGGGSPSNAHSPVMTSQDWVA